MADAVTFEPHFKLEYSIMDSAAARCLSPGAYGLLPDFLRKWLTETRDGKVSVSGVPFTFVSCRRPLNRDTFGSYRKELVEKGFIIVVNAQVGLYRWSESWRAYTPNFAEADRLDKHDEARRAQAQKTIEHRKGSAEKVVTTQDEGSAEFLGTTPDIEGKGSAEDSCTSAPKEGSAENPRSEQCGKSPHPLVRKSSAHSINTIRTIEENTTTTNQTLSPEGSPVAGGGGGGEASPEFKKAKAEYEAKVQGMMRKCYDANGSSRTIYDIDPATLRADAEEQLRLQEIHGPALPWQPTAAQSVPEPEDTRTDAEALAEALGGGLEIVEEAIRVKGLDWASGHAYSITHSKGIGNPVGVLVARLKGGYPAQPINGHAHDWYRQREGAIF